MAGKSLTLGKRKATESEEQEEERQIQELETELRQMSSKISDYRKSLPNQLVQALKSNLLAQRPIVLNQIGNFASHEINTNEEAASENEKIMNEKLSIFTEKSERNIAITPTVLKRMNESIARLNKVEKFSNLNIDRIFKKER